MLPWRLRNIAEWKPHFGRVVVTAPGYQRVDPDTLTGGSNEPGMRRQRSRTTRWAAARRGNGVRRLWTRGQGGGDRSWAAVRHRKPPESGRRLDLMGRPDQRLWGMGTLGRPCPAPRL